MGTPANRTRGLVVKGDDERSHMRGMGRTVSARAFGHNGAAGQIAWGDPETGASFCFLTNGIDEHEMRQWQRGPPSPTGPAVTASLIADDLSFTRPGTGADPWRTRGDAYCLSVVAIAVAAVLCLAVPAGARLHWVR